MDELLENVRTGWGNVGAWWDDVTELEGEDAPPPPTREAVELHNERSREHGHPDWVMEWSDEAASEAAEEYERGRRGLLERLDDRVSEASRQGMWLTVGVVVAVCATLLLLALAWFWFYGSLLRDNAPAIVSGLESIGIAYARGGR